MKKAGIKDKQLVLDILTESFEKNKSVNFTIKQDRNRKHRILSLMSYSFDLCNEFGEVLLTHDNKACALLLYPEKKKKNFNTILRDFKLLINSIGLFNLSKVLRRESIIKSHYPQNVPYLYLWYIGVRTTEQQKGIGSEMLSYLSGLSKSLKRPILLETSMSENLCFYSKHGFELYKNLSEPYDIYLLRKNCE